MAKVFVTLKEAVRLLKSRIEENTSMLLGALFPAGIGGHRSLLTDTTSVGDSISVDVGTLTQKYLARQIKGEDGYSRFSMQLFSNYNRNLNFKVNQITYVYV